MANWITISRIPLLTLIVWLLYRPSYGARDLAAWLIIVLIALDSLDGIVARKRGESSLLGSVLDIAADRTVEFVMWVVFSDLRAIPVVIPLIVLARGVFVDAIRAVAPSKGLKPFELLQTKVGRFLVGSPLLRTPFALAKAFAFFFLALMLAQQANGTLSQTTYALAQGGAWFAFALCLIRGLPVLIEAPRALRED